MRIIVVDSQAKAAALVRQPGDVVVVVEVTAEGR